MLAGQPRWLRCCMTANLIVLGATIFHLGAVKYDCVDAGELLPQRQRGCQHHDQPVAPQQQRAPAARLARHLLQAAETMAPLCRETLF